MFNVSAKRYRVEILTSTLAFSIRKIWDFSISASVANCCIDRFLSTRNFLKVAPIFFAMSFLSTTAKNAIVD